MDEFSTEARVDFFPKRANERVDDATFDVAIEIPDVIEDHGAGEDFVFVFEEIGEEIKLSFGEGKRAVLARCFSGVEIDFQVVNSQERIDVGGDPEAGFDAGEEFGDFEWFGEIVVGAQVEALDDAIQLRFGGEDNNRNLWRSVFDLSEDGFPGDIGEAKIEDDEVGMETGDGGETSRATPRACHDEAFIFEEVNDEREQGLVVFDD